MTTGDEWEQREALQPLDLVFAALLDDRPALAASMAKPLLQLVPVDTCDRHMAVLTGYCRRSWGAPVPHPDDIP
jgi:hypothetical protein